MIKNVILMIFVVFIILISGLFTVDVRENAVVLNNYTKQQKVYLPGVHFTLPLLTTVNTVYMNNQFLTADFPIIVSDESQPVKIKFLIKWKVVDPIKYINLIHHSDEDSIKIALTGAIDKALKEKDGVFSLSQLNLAIKPIGLPIKLDNDGLRIYDIQILNLKMWSIQDDFDNQFEPILINNETFDDDGIINADNNKNKLILQNEETNQIESIFKMQLESAFYTAQQIKTQAEIYQAKSYNQVKDSDSKFYNYFRKIEIYKQTAESKGDIPSLNQIYTE